VSGTGIQPELPGVGKTGSSRERYRAYLASPAWQAKRIAAFQRSHGICEVCKAAAAREVHHRSYGSFGHERPEDILALCPPSHRREDEKLRIERELALRESRKRRLWT